MKEFEQKKMVKAFVKHWQGKGYEKGESQKFWIDLLMNVFDELTMPPELRKAHQANDRAVMEAYGFIKKVDGKATWYSPS